jgi:hypothetical protein
VQAIDAPSIAADVVETGITAASEHLDHFTCVEIDDSAMPFRFVESLTSDPE